MFSDNYLAVQGLRTRYWQAGTQGSVVLLLHGIGCSVLEWAPNIEAMAAHHRVYALDLAGFGLTDKPADGPYTLPALAGFVLSFLDELGIERAHFAGNSLGGRLALQCAIAAAARVASMVLVDPAGIERRGTLVEFRLATLPLLGELFTRPTTLGTRLLWQKAFARPAAFVTAELVRTKLGFARLPGAQAAFLRCLRSFVDVQGFEPRQVAALHAALPTLRMPVLVLWGREDRLVPCTHAETLRQALPDVAVEVWDDCGHVPQIECAARFNARVPAFWAEVDRAEG